MAIDSNCMSSNQPGHWPVNSPSNLCSEIATATGNKARVQSWQLNSFPFTGTYKAALWQTAWPLVHRHTVYSCQVVLTPLGSRQSPFPAIEIKDLVTTGARESTVDLLCVLYLGAMALPFIHDAWHHIIKLWYELEGYFPFAKVTDHLMAPWQIVKWTIVHEAAIGNSLEGTTTSKCTSSD